MVDLPEDLRDQLDKGLLTKREAENLAKGLAPNGQRKPSRDSKGNPSE